MLRVSAKLVRALEKAVIQGEEITVPLLALLPEEAIAHLLELAAKHGNARFSLQADSLRKGKQQEESSRIPSKPKVHRIPLSPQERKKIRAKESRKAQRDFEKKKLLAEWAKRTGRKKRWAKIVLGGAPGLGKHA